MAVKYCLKIWYAVNLYSCMLLIIVRLRHKGSGLYLQGFLNDLLLVLDESPSDFECVINVTLNYLRIAMESTPSKLETVVRPISALRELVSFVKPATKIRPIANLIIKRPDWFIAEPKTSFVANETFSKSYLGAFLGVSVFDDRRLSSNFYHFPILFTNF